MRANHHGLLLSWATYEIDRRVSSATRKLRDPVVLRTRELSTDCGDPILPLIYRRGSSEAWRCDERLLPITAGVVQSVSGRRAAPVVPRVHRAGRRARGDRARARRVRRT